MEEEKKETLMELEEILRMERQREKQEDISAPEQVSIYLIYQLYTV